MNRIKELREAAGLKQSELADRMGVRPPSVFKWENGQAQPTAENLLKLADILDTTTDALLGRDTA